MGHKSALDSSQFSKGSGVDSDIKEESMKENSTDYTTGNADYALDVIIRNFKSIVPENQYIPDLGTWANLKNCSLNGLQSGLSRSGHSLFSFKDDTMILELRLQANNLQVRCSWSKSIGIFTLTGKAIGTCEIVTIKVLLSLDLKPGGVPILNIFEVTDNAPITTYITGIGDELGWLAEKIADCLIAKSVNQIRSTISKETKDVLQEELYELFGISSDSHCV